MKKLHEKQNLIQEHGKDIQNINSESISNVSENASRFNSIVKNNSKKNKKIYTNIKYQIVEMLFQKKKII